MEHHSPTVVALPPPQNNKKHDIFLSHSGKQKGFARDLCSRLCSRGYSVFFDENDDSLPPGGAFPRLIFSAANTCDLALVVISDDFLRSKWPMMELCAFADRLSALQSDRSPDAPHFTILPLFFKLSPTDAKDKSNVRKWKKVWKTLEVNNQGRISAAKCEEIVTKVLPLLNGVVRCPQSQQGESSYIDEVVDRISSILRPRNLIRFREGVDPHRHHVGKERLCKVILEEFQKLEGQHDSSSSQVSILGMYGVPGSGKSTLCDFLRESMFDEFGGKVIYLKLPTKLRECDDLLVKEQYVKLLSLLIPPDKKEFALMDLDQLYYRVYNLGASFNYKLFVVLDNISPSNCERYKAMVKAVVSSGILGAGSRVMLVAQTEAILENVFMEVKHMYSHAYASTQVPSLKKEEAMELIRNRYSSVTDDVLTDLLRKCSFASCSFMYIPFVFEQIGILLRGKGCNEVKELELFWKMVEQGKKDAVKKLVDINLKRLPEDLRVLFFDIALYIIPAGYAKLSDATPLLCRMHGINDTSELEWKRTELQKYCALSVMEEELTVHDIFTEHARSIPENSNRYVHRPSLNISDLLVASDQNGFSTMYPRRIHLKCLEARTIYIDIGKGSPYCCNDDEEVLLHLEVGDGARAVHVRNLSQYSKFILGLAGEPSSLVCLRTENVQQVALSDHVNLSDLVCLEMRNDDRESKFWQMSLSSSLKYVSHKIQKTVESTLWKPFFPRRYELNVRRHVFRRRMPWLRVIVLTNVGAGRLEIGGQYVPELEVFEVQNNREPIDLSICDAAKLRKLFIRACDYSFSLPSRHQYPVSRNPRKMVLQIRKCPKLREVDVDGSFDQVSVVDLLPAELQVLSLANDRGDKFIPMNSSKSSMHQLSQLETLRLSECRGLKNLEFTREFFSNCLPCLRTMVVMSCTSLGRLCIGPGCMPKLVRLEVSWCDKLRDFEGLEDLLMQQQLKSLELYELPQLRLEIECGSCGSSQLEGILVNGCPHLRIHFNVLEASKNLSRMDISADDAIRISNASKTITMQEEDCDPGLQSSSAASSAIDRMRFVEGRFTLLRILRLSGLDHLLEIEGIQHLPELLWLHMRDLPNLSRVSEAWPRSIQSIIFCRCPMLLHIPPLERTLELDHFECRECPRLKAVEGEITMTRSTRVEFIECKSMEVLPISMEQVREWGKRGRERRGSNLLRVYGSKFASVEVMRKWLWDEDTEMGSPVFEAEMGSPVFEAAVQALVWEHVVKGDCGAWDALRNYFSAALAHISNGDDDDDPLLKSYLRDLFFPSYPWQSLFYRFGFSTKKKEELPPEQQQQQEQLRKFQQWMLQTFHLHSPHDSRNVFEL